MSQTTIPNPDLEVASRFLHAIADDDELYVRVFHDSEDGKPGINHAGPVNRVLPWLAEKNQQGYGAFFTVNGGGTKKAEITRVRAFFADFDEPGTADELLKRCPLEPTLKVETSPGRFHCYWKVTGVPVEGYAEALETFIEVMGADPNAKDISRVLRIPGFIHLKDPDHPFQSVLVKGEGETYPWDVFGMWLRSQYKPKPRRITLQAPPSINGEEPPYVAAALEGAMRAIASAPEGSRNQTLNSEAYGLFGLVKGGYISEIKVRELLEHCAASTGLSQVEIVKTMESAYEAAKPRSVVDARVPTTPRGTITSIEDSDTAAIEFGVLDPLTDELPPVPSFDYSMLPEAFVSYVRNTAERMDKTSPDFVAVACMVIAASLVGGRALMQPKKHDSGWRLPVTLWGYGVGQPASKKSPALKAGKDLLGPIQKELAESQKEAMDDYRRAASTHKKVVAAIEKQFEKFLSPSGKNAQPPSSDEVRKKEMEVQQRLKDIQEPVEPKERRLLVNDTTMEQLILHMEGNQLGMMVYRDELSGFLSKMEREEYQHERAFILECREGYGNEYQQSRITRVEANLEHTILSILGGIQPAKLDRLVKQRASGGGDDGFLERFQMGVYPDLTVDATDVAVDGRAKERAQAFIKRLYDLDGDETVVYRFDPVAQADYDDWRRRHTAEVRDADPHWQAILGKYEGLVAALALLCHLGSDDYQHEEVGFPSLEMALKWTVYLRRHAARIYHTVHDPDTAAKQLLSHLHELPSPFTASTIRNKGWQGLKDRDSRKTAIDTLVKRNYLHADQVDTAGRPVTRYYINPEALEE